MKIDTMNLNRSIITLGILVGAATIGHATVVGFGNLGGNNTTVPGGLASLATADGSGFVVANGTTPNIGLVWDGNWDIHTSNFFAPIEIVTPVVASWDNEGNIPRVGQLDTGNHTIVFNADLGYGLVLNSFDFGHTAETAGTTVWNLNLVDSSLNEVWQTTVTFTNGNAIKVSPNFTGALGEDYTLRFNRTSSTYTSDGRHGLDNLSFNQIPEPGAASLLGLAGLALLSRRRK